MILVAPPSSNSLGFAYPQLSLQWAKTCTFCPCSLFWADVHLWNIYFRKTSNWKAYCCNQEIVDHSKKKEIDPFDKKKGSNLMVRIIGWKDFGYLPFKNKGISPFHHGAENIWFLILLPKEGTSTVGMC